jgi:hypothetical protein
MPFRHARVGQQPLEYKNDASPGRIEVTRRGSRRHGHHCGGLMSKALACLNTSNVMTVVDAPVRFRWLKRATRRDATSCAQEPAPIARPGAYDPVERYDEDLRNRLFLDRKAGIGAIVANGGEAVPSDRRVRNHRAVAADQLHLHQAPAFVVPDVLRITALDLVVMSFQGAGAEA